MLTRAQKEEQVDVLREKLGKATSVIVADYRGIDVQSINSLRGKIRSGEDGYEYQVAKNSLLRRAAEGGPAEAIAEQFQGPTPRAPRTRKRRPGAHPASLVA